MKEKHFLFFFLIFLAPSLSMCSEDDLKFKTAGGGININQREH